ncbi:hypothetical protein [Erwinia sp. 198]|uniref:hypothetical protein n=1 Tax=Erwinia sp. 198 TaxID=2022746 RepID=UPI000F677C2B|nr:hypothetical protein [Erwinia sp. 198]
MISITLVAAASLSVAERAEKETACRALYAPHHGCVSPAFSRGITVSLIKSQKKQAVENLRLAGKTFGNDREKHAYGA